MAGLRSESTAAHGGEEEKRPGLIQSVATATRFLTILANGEEPLALGELARRAGTGNSSAHRYVQSLVKEGLATQDPASGLYDLGPAALNIGLAALQRIDPVDIATRHAKELASHYGINAGIVIWTSRGPTVVRWFRRANYIIGSLGLGDILPLDNTATGLVYQAFLPANIIEEARQVQERHFDGSPPNQAVLEQVRSDCFAELTGHLYPEIAGQAVPIFDAQREIACVMATVTNLAATRDMGDGAALLERARLIAKETGGMAALAGG